MQQLVVPQFIDVEDRIIGPITTRQFIILIVCGIVIFLEYKLSDITLFLALAIPTFAAFGLVAFLRVNGMPFHYFLLNLAQTLKKPAIRIWQRDLTMVAKSKSGGTKDEKKETAPLVVHKHPLSSARLSDLSLIIDTGGVYEGAGVEPEISFKIEEADSPGTGINSVRRFAGFSFRR